MAEIMVDGQWIPCPVESPNSRNDTDGKPPVFIVLHSTGGKFAGAVRWLMNALAPKRPSAHFVISRTGEIRQLVSIYRVAFHAGNSKYGGYSNLNNCSIGIEQEHYDRKQDWPGVQTRATAHLCAVLCKRFNLPAKAIIGHADCCMPRGRKIDPWEFPWGYFRLEVAKYMKALKGESND